MVDKEKFGERQVCFACGCKFYDMKRHPPTCPKCGVDVSKPPKVVEETTFNHDEIDEVDNDLPETLDDENLEVDSEDELGDELTDDMSDED
ncbi:MAG: FYDLN acid domain-containing protein [Myxococcota bacterium]|jgi:hypothetical protein|nr:FYDLN acid domain-containing protein [Myxococcota bacterium]OQC42677.1 MAG: Protein of unknown function (FYDLN_acid) [Deltaproteobacteria bacterium ADurb.Bin058]HHW96270.1 hypothetical protein [Oligoflexales bacterium]MBP8971874.1 FYDLN acid domain-containing protein [Myxococcota bacterium]HOE81377.1 FYDLN acid domain-containing protein [Myxococcota bacterium]